MPYMDAGGKVAEVNDFSRLHWNLTAAGQHQQQNYPSEL